MVRNLEAWDQLVFEDVNFPDAAAFSAALTTAGADVLLAYEDVLVHFEATTVDTVEAAAAHLFV